MDVFRYAREFRLGLSGNKEINDLIKGYNPELHPICGPCIRGGPAELAETPGYTQPEKGADACHLCYLARKEMQQKFPDILAPNQVYGQNIDNRLENHT